MKRSFLHWPKAASIYTMTGLLSAWLVNAADAPQPTPPPPGPGLGGSRLARGPNGPSGGGGGIGASIQGQRAGGMVLDGQQLQLFRQATVKSGNELGKLDGQLRAAQKELMQAVLAEMYDEKVVREKAEATAKIQVEITALRAKAFSTVAPTLKPEQREQLENSAVGAGMLMGSGVPTARRAQTGQ